MPFSKKINYHVHNEEGFVDNGSSLEVCQDLVCLDSIESHVLGVLKGGYEGHDDARSSPNLVERIVS